MKIFSKKIFKISISLFLIITLFTGFFSGSVFANDGSANYEKIKDAALNIHSENISPPADVAGMKNRINNYLNSDSDTKTFMATASQQGFNEIEPNNTTSQANVINNNYSGEPDYIIGGMINDVYYDIDYYRFTVSTTGTVLAVGVWGDTSYHNLGWEDDLYIAICDSNNNIIYASTFLDLGADGTCTCLAGVLTPGTYYLVVLASDEYHYLYVDQVYGVGLDFVPNVTVNFNSQGGSSVASVSLPTDSTVTAPTQPTRTGYNFGGWYKEASCINEWNFTSDKVTTNTTLYAKWIPIIYNITFDSQGGSAVSGTTAVYDSLLTAPAQPTKDSVYFGGWYKESACTNVWNFSTDTVKGNTTLYAKWTNTPPSITFNSQGGSSVTGTSALYGSLITAPAEPTRERYTFQGWYKEAGCVNQWNFSSDRIIGDTTLYAKWGLHTVTYQSHVQNIGWQTWMSNSESSGTSGQSLRLEAMHIKLENLSGGIEYRTHVQNIGWQNWVSNGAMAGTSGQSLRLEAIDIRLTGDAADQYDIYYRVHAQNFGWMDWAKNGASAGTAGFAYRLEAIQIVLVPKGGEAPGATTKPFVDKNAPAPTTGPTVNYQSHVQNIGWQNWANNGATSGTSGQSLRLEAMKIQLANIDGGIEYRTHVQNIGWMNWVANGALSGTEGLSYRLEAIDIRLTGDAADQYDIYYRVHAQNFGWMGWAKNGASAGTAGYAYRLEAIQIVLVPKGGEAPGSTAGSFVQR